MKEDLLTKSQKIILKAALGNFGRFFIGLAILISSCEPKTNAMEQELYDGPNFEMDDVFTKLSDSAKVIMTLRAPKERSFQNADREWPGGLFLEYLNDRGEVKTTFEADYVFYTQKENLYRSEGNVKVINLQNGDRLNTEELFWDPAGERFYTHRFVTIETDEEVHTGEGLEANQDFSKYKILKPTGSIRVQQ